MGQYEITSEGINLFLANLNCRNGKLNYHNAITTFIFWLLKIGYLKENPMEKVEKPKRAKKLLSSVTQEQVELLVNRADNLRDKAIIALLFDSGMRLSEIATIRVTDIDWDSYTITINGKGNKQRRAPFNQRSAKLLREWLTQYNPNGCNIWGIQSWGIQTMIKRLSKVTGMKFSCHAFRRGFACDLHRKGLSTLDIMHLGGWEELTMALRYTRSITFDDCLSHYHNVHRQQR